MDLTTLYGGPRYCVSCGVRQDYRRQQGGYVDLMSHWECGECMRERLARERGL